MKRVLFVTYYFPPSGGPGVQRPLKTARYLPEFGWQPHVLTVDPASAAYPQLDDTLQADIPAELPISRTRARDPFTWYGRIVGKTRSDAIGVGFTADGKPGLMERLARWIRANLFLPDARKGWVPFAVRRALELHRDRPFDAIITTGPPHSAHLVGYALCTKAGVPWLADVRDAWPDPSYSSMLPTTTMAAARDASRRNRVLVAADVRVAVTQGLADAMQAATGESYHVIPNGFDEADFRTPSDNVNPGLRPSSKEFVIVHTGTLSPGRNPEPLWKVLSDPDASSKWKEVRVRLIGSVDASVRESVHSHGLDGIVDCVPYVTHPEAVAEMQKADLLLLPINRVPDASGIVTGKIFEYLASRRPVLGLGNPEGEAAGILSSTQAGSMIDYEDEASIARFLERHLSAWKAQRPETGANPDAIALYSRRAQTACIAELLDSIT